LTHTVRIKINLFKHWWCHCSIRLRGFQTDF